MTVPPAKVAGLMFRVLKALHRQGLIVSHDAHVYTIRSATDPDGLAAEVLECSNYERPFR